MALAEDITALPGELTARLTERGFDKDRLVAQAGLVGSDRLARNQLSGTVTPPAPEMIGDLPDPSSDAYQALKKRGEALLSSGQVALCVLAGGMATRMGGVVKALVEALDGQTFLELRLREQQVISDRYGAPMPLWLMTSEATNGPIGEALAKANAPNVVQRFEQCASLRLTKDGGLFRDTNGEPSVYATGHGDLPDALHRSGLLKDFVERGGRVVWLANLDNLGATIDPALLGYHLDGGAEVTVELVDKEPGDKGGGPVVHNGKPIITETFRMPASLDQDAIPVFNTNTFLIDARALAALDFGFTFVEVEKTVDGKPAIQFERLVGEITSPLQTKFVRVPRTGVATRFLPVKDHDELARRRDDIRALAIDRGLLDASGAESDR